MPVVAGVTAITLFSLGGVAGSLLQGVVMARLGARRVISAEFALSVLLIGSLGILPGSFTLIMSVAASLGVFVQGAQAGLNALVAGFYPTSIRSTGIGWALAMGRIGSIVGPILGGVMLSLHWDLQQIFLAGTIPAFLAGVAVLAGGKNNVASGQPINLEIDAIAAEGRLL
jgi:AAHS family 4-hydroxybenzoate transporter-like MFS transporter